MIGSWYEMPRWKKTAVFRDRSRQSPRDTGFRCRIGRTKVPLEKNFVFLKKKEEASVSLFRHWHHADGLTSAFFESEFVFFASPTQSDDVAQMIDEGYSF